MNKKTVITILAIIAIATAFGAYYYLQQTAFQEISAPYSPPKRIAAPATTTIEQIDTSDWKVYRNEKYGFEVRYPSEWKFGETSSFLILADQQDYIDFYIYGKTNIKLPIIGFMVKVFVDKDIVPEGMLQQEALKLEEGRGLIPLIEEQFLTINNIFAYRAKRMLKKGDPIFDRIYTGILRTALEYTYLKNNTLYRVWFQIDNEEPDEMIKIFDKVAMTFVFLEKN